MYGLGPGYLGLTNVPIELNILYGVFLKLLSQNFRRVKLGLKNSVTVRLPGDPDLL